MITSNDAASAIRQATPLACKRINAMSSVMFRTRGGRLGSGMGSLLEALWGFHTNKLLPKVCAEATECELGWFSDHAYNDFACVKKDATWDSETREGELLRIEAKSMNLGAKESKGHFDELIHNLGEQDLLLVLIWEWKPVDTIRLYPHIEDHFIGSARSIARLRDDLHKARGGSFVDKDDCPDGCSPSDCKHHGEPLNAKEKRERSSGPKKSKPDGSSHAANFGGLVRMLKTESEEARKIFREIRKNDDDAHNYISFIHKNYPKEEVNQYLLEEWKSLAGKLGISIKKASGRDKIISRIQDNFPNYRDQIRNL